MSDKKIIIIGNSPTITSSKLGKVIDEFETIVRFNNFVTDGYEQFVGSKTDIWAIGTSSSIFAISPDDFREVWYKSSTPQTKLEAKFKGRIPTEKMNLLLDPPYDFNLEGLDTSNPSTGFRAIMTALQRYETVTVHGFIFFQETEGKFFRHYFGSDHQHVFYKKNIQSGVWRDKKMLDDINEAIKKNTGVAFGKHHDGRSELRAVQHLNSQGRISFLRSDDITEEFFNKYKKE